MYLKYRDLLRGVFEKYKQYFKRFYEKNMNEYLKHFLSGHTFYLLSYDMFINCESLNLYLT
jgi:hypothetical protein